MLKQYCNGVKKVKLYRHKSEPGSFSIEAAVILPCALLFFFVLVLLVQMANYELLWHTAGNSACQELEAIVAAAGSFSQADMKQKLLGKLTARLPTQVTDRLLKFTDGMLSANYLLRRQSNLFQEMNGRSRNLNTRLITNFRAFISVNEAKHQIHYKSVYDYNLLLWRKKREFYYVVPLWNVYPLGTLGKSSTAGENKDEKNLTIWSKGNFARGDEFQSKYHANLPKNFPTINRFSDGVATSIKSIDLTNPNLEDDNYLSNRIGGLAQSLLSFAGYQGQNGNWPTIKAAEIKIRRLQLIVPENSPPAILKKVKNILRQYPGIEYEIITDEKSYKYVSEDPAEKGGSDQQN